LQGKHAERDILLSMRDDLHRGRAGFGRGRLLDGTRARYVWLRAWLAAREERKRGRRACYEKKRRTIVQIRESLNEFRDKEEGAGGDSGLGERRRFEK